MEGLARSRAGLARARPRRSRPSTTSVTAFVKYASSCSATYSSISVHRAAGLGDQQARADATASSGLGRDEEQVHRLSHTAASRATTITAASCRKRGVERRERLVVGTRRGGPGAPASVAPWFALADDRLPTSIARAGRADARELRRVDAVDEDQARRRLVDMEACDIVGAQRRCGARRRTERLLRQRRDVGEAPGLVAQSSARAARRRARVAAPRSALSQPA